MPRDPKHDPLFEPIPVGPKVLKNRFYQTAQCNGAGSDRPGMQAAHRAVKAEGGWASLCTEYCSVHPETDATPYISTRLWDDIDVINLRHMCDSVHAHGALAAVELWYGGGGTVGPCYESRAIPRAAGNYPAEGPSWVYCAEADEDDIRDLIRIYCDAAKRAEQAGFDIIYLYAADSFLPLQFLMPFNNKRTDKYGGSLANRSRFTIETLTAMKKAVGEHSAIAIRFTNDGLEGPGKVEAHDEGLKFIELVHGEGLVDLWDLKIGTGFENGEDLASSRFQGSNHQLPFMGGVKGVIGDVPLVCVGHLTSPDEMAANIVNGHYDIIGATRASIADPFLPRKVDEGRLDDIRECIGCNMCVSRWEIAGHAQIVCTQNATTMEEYRRGWHPEKFAPAADPCSVLVVGAGPAGMECARVLGERGYDVHLREATAEIGGHLKDVQRYPGLAEWGRITSYRQIQLDKLDTVEVHTGVGFMSSDDILTYGADKVVLAVGSDWAGDGFNGYTLAGLPGADASLPQFATPEQVMAGKAIGERVVVVEGEGFITGIAMAEMLRDQGKEVSVVTFLDSTAPYLVYTTEGRNLARMMHEKGITEYALHWIEKLEVGNTVKLTMYYMLRDGPKRGGPNPGGLPRTASSEASVLECDTVVLSTARVPRTSLYTELKARHSEWAKEGLQAVYRVGDCHAPRLIPEAIFDGHRLAREFESDNPQQPLPYLRERSIWGQSPPS